MYRPKITQHNVFGDDTVAAQTGNISSVVDRMLRVATKVTESYAGDIVYEINALQTAISKEPGKAFSRLLAFRESGVDQYGLSVNEQTGSLVMYPERELPVSGIQFWTLRYLPDNKMVVFERVDLIS